MAFHEMESNKTGVDVIMRERSETDWYHERFQLVIEAGLNSGQELTRFKVG